MSATPTAQPEVLWAQRSSDVDANRNVIWLTISVPDLDPNSVKVEWTNPSHLRFEGTSNPPHMQKGSTASQVEKKHFVFDYDLFGEVEEVTEKRRLTNKSLILTVKKKELTEEYWPRLIKEKKKVQTIKTDFSKWKDQDEQNDEEEPEEDAGGMGGMGGMPGMGGGGGMGGMNPEDMAKMMEQFKAGGGVGGDADFGDDSDEEFEDDEEEEEGEGKEKKKDDDADLPPLE